MTWKHCRRQWRQPRTLKLCQAISGRNYEVCVQGPLERQWTLMRILCLSGIAWKAWSACTSRARPHSEEGKAATRLILCTPIIPFLRDFCWLGSRPLQDAQATRAARAGSGSCRPLTTCQGRVQHKRVWWPSQEVWAAQLAHGEKSHCQELLASAAALPSHTALAPATQP